MGQPDTQQGPAQTGDSNTGGDYLGYSDYADTLWARILAAVNKDTEEVKKADAKGQTPGLGDDPLVVGIFGEWGAGKSKLLKLILERATDLKKHRERQRKQDGGNFDLTVPVFFQPWKYEHEPHLLVPMMLHILAALKDTLKRSKTFSENLEEKAEPFWQAALQSLPAVISVFETLLKSVLTTFGQAAPSHMGAQLSVARWLAKILPKSKQPTQNLAKELKYTNDSRHYYEIHEHLKAVTRPKTDKNIRQGENIRGDVRINFVIFIDDLDRCLPEKAVETLELIKTIFNAESFAFVLALDEEVVERGIGHRYKDYTLVGKKPEMPITGFEYLEKIVHLPFRLPALTRQQALEFMQRYEDELLQSRTKDVAYPADAKTDETKQAFRAQWVAHRSWLGKPTTAMQQASSASHLSLQQEPLGDHMAGVSKTTRQGMPGTTTKPYLAHLVVNSFDAFVPRKLIRVVELFHQVVDVLEKRGRLDKLQVNSAIDPRLLMAFLLLQLFHPDLYRTFRRTRVGFEEVLDAFNNDTLGQATSDLDLWRWAAMGYDKQQLAKQEPLPPVSYEKAVLMIGSIEAKARFKAQQIYLPIVQRLVEHRAAQRHVFDPLRLFASLKASDIKSATFSERYSREYYSLLTQDGASALDLIDLEIMPAPVVADDAGEKLRDHTAMGAGMHTAPVHMGGAKQTEMPTAPAEPSSGTTEQSKPPVRRPRRAGDAETLFNALVSTAQREQQSAPTNVGLKAGEWLDASSARELHQRLTKWLDGVSKEQKPEAERRLLRGLQYLASHITRDDTEMFWDLVKDVAHGGELGDPLKDTDQLQARELWADVRSTLGLDPRFDRETRYGKVTKDNKTSPGVLLYLPKERSKILTGLATTDKTTAEPIPGFIHIPGGEFLMGQTGESNNPARQIEIEKPFYIARHLTTVDQYASFVDDGGYAQDGWWDKQGIEWREGLFDSKVEDKQYREHLAARRLDSRKVPMYWREQRSHGSRPVMRLSWFEARAYTRWLQDRLSGEGPHGALFAPQGVLAGYKVVLPTEAQWERAAKAQDLTRSDSQRVWPWRGDDKTAHLKANIRASYLGRASVVGLFEANPVGLHDMAGNLWEWLDNLVDGKGDTVQRRLATHKELKLLEDFDKSDRPALRGGSWHGSADDARCSYRRMNVPVNWDFNVGFRVVLSLVNLKSET
jgi:formylglycine-generating enzyme required for sulfatase activity